MRAGFVESCLAHKILAIEALREQGDLHSFNDI
jgi:hypothetical protein